MSETPIDTAHAAMEADRSDETARLRFYERLVDAELFLLLAAEPEGETLDPETFDVDGQSFVAVFDMPDRLAAFAERPVPYAALSGRAVVEMLAGQGAGLALNPDAAPSAMLLGPDAVSWMAEMVGTGPERVEARVSELTPPGNLPEALFGSLDTKLSTAAGRARSAYLVGVRYDDGGKGHLLAFIDALPGAGPALARAVNEALVFSGLEAGALDVAFFEGTDAIAARLARVGLRYDLPQPEAAASPAAPGSDPDAPPRLR
ncbi:SseB protein N-terminal domain-containing protein [Tranquillimonas rosea]|uniref:SseB protein N-terminal domain-containing protein n=1 Tax=Tranquillimonas rosea TaxID=641238 RepID=A0A1H9TV57_9RHOB|nr:SseB family protein [Tranquillimonas rosea]SES00911.1 SseB protein N-terminal domain-containing protein [Tranquillimonas rosea]